MNRTTFAASLVAACSLVCASGAQAQELDWAQKMFEKQSHDFGTIARGADIVYRLKLTNKYAQDVHIAHLRTACQCVQAQMPANATLKPGESTFIPISMDTRRFTREKNSAVIIVFDAPEYKEVNIPIHAYIRTDVVLTPGLAEFGPVPVGAEQTRQIEVAYAGRPDWKIKDVVVKSEHVSAKVVEVSRGGGRATYQLTVTVAGTAPVGDIRELITLTTDDASSPEVPVLVEAKVEPEFTVTPPIVALGTMTPGQKKTVNVVIKGRKPFQIEKIESETGSDAFQAQLPQKASQIHVLPLVVTAPTNGGPLSEDFTVTIEGHTQPVHFKASGKIAGAAGTAN